MKIFRVRNGHLLLFLLLAGTLTCFATDSASSRIVTDFAGRQVRVPLHVQKVYCTVPACSLLINTISPGHLMAGSTPSLEIGVKSQTHTFRPAGAGRSGAGANIEELIKLHPDLVLVMNSFPDQAARSRMEQIEQQAHIPTYYVSMALNDTPAVYEQLGKLLGEETRANELAKYSRDALQRVESVVKTIPMDRRPRIYYASGLNGLQTIRAGEPHIEAIERAGGINVAQLPAGPYSASVGQVTLEQVLIWKPDIVLTYESQVLPNPFYTQKIWTDPLWQQVPAVKRHAVYEIPGSPAGWVAPPASINRILGILWLAKLLYPDRFAYDTRQEVRTFYAKFYRLQISDKDLNDLLAHSFR